VAEALGFIVSLVASAGDGALADLNVLGLALLARALAAGGGAFARHEALLALLREDAWAALAAAARGGGLAALAGACQAALALYCTLGSAVLLQARARGRGGPPSVCLLALGVSAGWLTRARARTRCCRRAALPPAALPPGVCMRVCSCSGKARCTAPERPRRLRRTSVRARCSRSRPIVNCHPPVSLVDAFVLQV